MFKQYRLWIASGFCLVLCVYTLTAGQQSDARTAQPADKPAVAAASRATTVELHLKIADPTSGFTLEATKDVSAGISAFDAMRQVVVVDHRRLPGIGQFVTGLCSVEAPRGQFWALYVNDKFSHQGISAIKLNADTEIEWKMQSRDTIGDRSPSPSPGPSPGPGEGL
jgi:hypothetical protein